MTEHKAYKDGMEAGIALALGWFWRGVILRDVARDERIAADYHQFAVSCKRAGKQHEACNRFDKMVNCNKDALSFEQEAVELEASIAQRRAWAAE